MKAADLRDIPPGKKLYDHVVKGLFIRANASGSKTFFLVYRDNTKKQRKITLGKYGQLTLEGARKAAQSLLSRIAAGENPAEENAKAKSEMTVYELMQLVLKEYWGIQRYLDSGLFQQVLWAVKNDFSKIGTLHLSELTIKAVHDWHRSMEHKPCQANHVLAYLKTAINYAIKNGLTDIRNPCSAVKKFPSHPRSRYATPEEIKQIGGYLEKEFETNPIPAMYIYMILTTGTRPRAVERMLWKNLVIKHNLKGEEVGIITFFGKTSAKTGEDEKIIVPPKTMAMLKRLPKINEYIVPCTVPTRLWRRIRKTFNLKNLWMRDLRRTYASVALSSGKVSLSQVGELLNHRCYETTKIYAKMMMDQKINSAMEIENSLNAIIHHP